MREIKFRAKRIDNGEWVEGGILHQTDYYGDKVDKYFIIDGTYTVDYDIGEAFEVDENTVCQYTGLKDMSGNKIWENDIINYGFRNEKGIVRFGTHENVSSKNQGFYVEWTNKWCSYRQDLGYFANIFEASVIGNIFDNPELLNNTDKQAGEYADNEVLKSAT